MSPTFLGHLVGELSEFEQDKRTVAVACLCLKSSKKRLNVFAVSNNRYNSGIVRVAERLGYRRVPNVFAGPNQTDAEQIILNYAEEVAVLSPDVKTPLAPSRKPCGPKRQNCLQRILSLRPFGVVLVSGYYE
jgi:hypothetical protein